MMEGLSPRDKGILVLKMIGGAIVFILLLNVLM